MQDSKPQRWRNLELLKAKLRRAAAQAERGELIPGEQVFEELRQYSARTGG
jgi:hypothetical protein